MLHLLKKEQEIGQERQVECLQKIFMEDTLSTNTTLKVFLWVQHLMTVNDIYLILTKGKKKEYIILYQD